MEALKMERPMDKWNDDRLDELSRRMDEGFKEMRAGFARTATREDLKKVENRVDRLYYGCVTLLVLLIGSSVAETALG